jgi:hypothetical protein
MAWLRRLGGPLVACLLLLLAAAPTFDGFVCLNDPPAADAQVSNEDRAAAHLEEGRANPAQDTGDLCPHGHCHHGATFLTAISGFTAGVRANSRPRPQVMAPLASRSPSGLERPPRV